MLRWRLLLGAIFIAALVGLFWLDDALAAEGPLAPGVILVPLALVVTMAATREFLALVRTREPSVGGACLYVGNWAIVAAPWLAASAGRADRLGAWQLGAFVVSVLATFLGEILRYDKDESKRVTERLALKVLGLAYLGLCMSFIVRLRLTPAGLFPLVLMLVVVKMGDIGAYTVGRTFGKHKLAPRLSPGKTWEGFFGGLAFSVLGGIACGYLFDQGQLHRYIPFALLVGIAGVIGDLAESLLKRDFGVKDSSTWMPGFGGVLDLVDSPLFAAPVAWVVWEIGLRAI